MHRAVSTNYHVRSMQEGDLDCVYAIEKVAYHASWPRDALRDCMRVGFDCRVIELELDSKVAIIGYIISRYNENTCFILNFVIAPTFQNKGYGALLLKITMASLTQPGIETISLDARPSNSAALHLYHKMGFQKTRIKRGYYRDAQGIENALVLEKKTGDKMK